MIKRLFSRWPYILAFILLLTACGSPAGPSPMLESEAGSMQKVDVGEFDPVYSVASTLLQTGSSPMGSWNEIGNGWSEQHNVSYRQSVNFKYTASDGTEYIIHAGEGSGVASGNDWWKELRSTSLDGITISTQEDFCASVTINTTDGTITAKIGYKDGAWRFSQ